MDSLLTTPGTFVIGCNYWASHAGTRMWSDWQPDIVDADLRQLSECGLQVLRVFPLWPDFQPLVTLYSGGGRAREIRAAASTGDLPPLPDTPEGQAGIAPDMMARFQQLADMAAAHGLKLVVGLLTGWMSGRLYVPPAFEGLNVLTDPAAIRWETRFVRYFVRRFKDHPAIIAWDLGNECNVMAPVPSDDAAWAWVSAITNAIRLEDASRPVVSGLHDNQGHWSPEVMGELADLLTTHPYPIWTEHCDQDSVNTIRTILHSTAESRLYADWGGKPCIAEELGTLGPMLASEAVAADFVRACLLSLWAHDSHGLLWWCAYDQQHLEHPPYDWNTVERELGLIRSDRTPKPVLAQMGAFRTFLDSLPFQRLPAHPREAVCLLSLDQDQWGVAYSAFVLARQAGLELEFQQGEQPLKDARLYLVPSANGHTVLSRHRWLDLLEKVRAGATLYLSLDEALLAEFKETFGLEVQVRQRRPDGEVRFHLTGGQPLRLSARFRLDLRPTTAEVLAREPDGNPVFTRCDYGQGQIYFLSAPLESALANLPGAVHQLGAQPFWHIYQRVAAGLFPDRAVRKDHPMLGLSEHPFDDYRRVVIAINYSPAPIQATLSLAPGWQIGQCWRGAVANGQVEIGANDGVVFEVVG